MQFDNLWVLGGEIIRDLNETQSLRKRPIEDLVFDAIQQQDSGRRRSYGEGHG
jgi:hypothetical protein